MRHMKWEEYLRRVHGAWLGKCVGVALGKPVEGQKKLHNFTFYPEPPEREKFTDDDTDLPVARLHALRERGPWISALDLAEEWLEHMRYPWCEYSIATENLKLGLLPPWCGKFNNDFFKTGMGATLRGDFWGWVCPGDPELAAEFAKADGSVDHADEGVLGEMFTSAVAAEMFFAQSPSQALLAGLSVLPRDSEVARCVRLVMRWVSQGLDWKEVRARILHEFGHPDITQCHQNIGFVTLALLASEGDFERAILSAVNCGYDTDCTGGLAGSMMGAFVGVDGIPERWAEPISDKLVLGWGIEGLPREWSIRELARLTAEAGAAVVNARSGRVRIEGAPKPEEMPLSPPEPPEVSLCVEPLDEPFSAPGVERRFEVTILNLRHKPLCGRLSVALPRGWCAKPGGIEVALDPGESCRLTISVVPSEEIRPSQAVEFALEAEGRRLTERCGLVGARRWIVYGPFDNSDGKGLERPFLPEPDIGPDLSPPPEAEEPFERREVWIPTDRIPVDEIFGTPMPFTLYLLNFIKSPEERRAVLLVGSSDGVRIWLNGELVHEEHSHRFPHPHGSRVGLRLKEGWNALLVKVARCTNTCQLRLRLLRDDLQPMVDIDRTSLPE